MAWMLPVATAATGIIGGMMQGNSARDASREQSQSQLESARIAANAARFTPVGVMGRYGSSNFGYDSTGRLNSAGYNLSPEALAQQNQLAGYTQRNLDQYGQAFDQSQALGQAGNSMFGLGQQYLGTSPQEQAQKYMSQQQGLLAGGREQQLAALRNQQQQTGRAGLATGATSTGMMATNPEMAAYYNSIAQQDANLAAQSTQGGMDYAKFGQGMMTAGAGAYDQMYGMQNNAYTPYQTAQSGVQGLEGQGQNMMNLGAKLGSSQAQAGAYQGGMLQAGGNAAANSMFNANAYSPWGNALSGSSQALGQYRTGQRQAQPQWANAGESGQGTYAGSTQSGMLNNQW